MNHWLPGASSGFCAPTGQSRGGPWRTRSRRRSGVASTGSHHESTNHVAPASAKARAWSWAAPGSEESRPDATNPPLKNLQRTLRWDGIVVQARGATPEEAEAGPDAVRELTAWIAEQRGPDAGPFDVVASGLLSSDRDEARDQARAFADAGATWFVDSWWDPAEATPERLLERVRQGPPTL